MRTTFNVSQEICFLKEGENLLQHVTTSYNMLQDVTKKRSPRTSLAVDQKFFFLNGGINCYNVLQRVTMHCKRLQEIGMCTAFDVAQTIYFLKEGEKLL